MPLNRRPTPPPLSNPALTPALPLSPAAAVGAAPALPAIPQAPHQAADQAASPQQAGEQSTSDAAKLSRAGLSMGATPLAKRGVASSPGPAAVGARATLRYNPKNPRRSVLLPRRRRRLTVAVRVGAPDLAGESDQASEPNQAGEPDHARAAARRGPLSLGGAVSSPSNSTAGPGLVSMAAGALLQPVAGYAGKVLGYHAMEAAEPVTEGVQSMAEAMRTSGLVAAGLERGDGPGDGSGFVSETSSIATPVTKSSSSSLKTSSTDTTDTADPNKPSASLTKPAPLAAALARLTRSSQSHVRPLHRTTTTATRDAWKSDGDGGSGEDVASVMDESDGVALAVAGRGTDLENLLGGELIVTVLDAQVCTALTGQALSLTKSENALRKMIGVCLM